MKTFSEFTTELSEAFGFGEPKSLNDIVKKFDGVEVIETLGPAMKVFVPQEDAPKFFSNFILDDRITKTPLSSSIK